MTVSTTANIITYDGDGADVTWPFPYAVEDDDQFVVTVTDEDGEETVLASNQYTVVINSAVAPNPTPVGATITYPLSGSPLAVGELITIERIADLTQEVSLPDQGTLYPSVIESALDLLTMMMQQISTQTTQAVRFAVSDDEHERLPPASEIAGKLMGFDDDGNPIAVELTDAGEVLVSSAMIPVVESATLALARTNLGLGDMAVEDIGAGLEDNGSGAVRTILTNVTDSTNQAVVASFHMTDRRAVGALTYTCPAISTLFSSFGFYITALDSAVSIAVNAADNFSGMSSGTALSIPPGTQVYISCSGTTWFARNVDSFGLNAACNLRINATVSGNALTIALKDRNNNDPSTASPVMIQFRDATAANGPVVNRALTSVLAITVPDTATLGTANGVAFRLWVVVFDNAGTLILGVIQTVTGGGTPTAIFPLDESAVQSPTAISTGADSAATFYAASAATSKSFRILGYIDFSSGQATAGTWTTSPDKVQPFGPGIKLPGDSVKEVITRVTAVSTLTTAFPVDNTIPQITEGTSVGTRTFTGTSKCNLVELSARLYGTKSVGAGNFGLGIFQTGVSDAIAVGWGDCRNASTRSFAEASNIIPISTASEITFDLQGSVDSNTLTVNGDAGVRVWGGALVSFLKAREIMV